MTSQFFFKAQSFLIMTLIYFSFIFQSSNVFAENTQAPFSKQSIVSSGDESGTETIRLRLLFDKVPQAKKKKFFEKFGRIFSRFLNVAGFFPFKLFEYTIISGGWELLSNESKIDKIRSAMLKGVLSDKTLSEELAKGYNACIKMAKENNTSKKSCSPLQDDLNIIATNFAQENIHKINIMDFDEMEEIEKNAHYVLVYEVALKNILEKGFSKVGILTKDERIELKSAAKRITSDYKTCLNNSRDLDEASDCDHKIGVSAPYRIGMEVFKIQLDKNISCEVSPLQYAKLKHQAINQFNLCSEETYFKALSKKKSKKGEKVTLDSGNIIKGCVFSGILDIVGDIAELKVNQAVSEQKKKLQTPSNTSRISGKEKIEQCLLEEKIITSEKSFYNYQILQDTSIDDFRKTITYCSQKVTQSTGKSIVSMLVKSNPEITSTFDDFQQINLVNDIIEKAYTPCLSLYSDKDPSGCAGVIELVATKNVVQKRLRDTVAAQANNDKGLINRLVYRANKSFSQCMENKKNNMFSNISLKEDIIKSNSWCATLKQRTCFDEKLTPRQCRPYMTKYDDNQSAVCLKKAIIPLSHEVSGHTIRTEIKSNQQLKDLGIVFTKDQLHHLQHLSQSCFQRLINCSKKEITKNKDTEISQITCYEKNESLLNVNDKTDMITERCTNEVYKSILPTVVEKVISREIESNFTNYRIKEIKRLLNFYKDKTFVKYKRVVKKLKIELKEISEKFDKSKKDLVQQLKSSFKESIKKKIGMDSMLNEIPSMRSHATFLIFQNVVNDNLDKYISKDSSQKEHSALREKVLSSIIGDNFLKKLSQTKTDKEYEDLINMTQVTLITAISEQVIKDNIFASTPKELGEVYKNKVAQTMKDQFNKCLDKDPSRTDICSNMITKKATRDIVITAIKQEAKGLIKNDNLGYFENLTERLSKAPVDKALEKNSNFIEKCLNPLDISTDSDDYTDQTKGCTLMAVLNFTTNIINLYLKKYKPYLTMKQYKIVTYRVNTCLQSTKVKAVKETFTKLSPTKENLFNAFSTNPFIDTDWLQLRLNSCVTSFKNNIKHRLWKRF